MVSLANGQTLTSTLNGTFVEGITGINNTFFLETPPVQTETVIFYSTDPTYTDVYDSYQDTDGTDGFTWDADMGNMFPGCVVWAEFYDASDVVIGYSSDYPLSIIPTPHWLINGSADNVTENNGIIEFDAILPLLNSSPNSMPNDVPGLNSRPYNLMNSNVSIHIVYDINQNPSASQLGIPSMNFNLNVLNQITIPYTYNLDDASNLLSLDDNFNLSYQITGTYQTPEFKIKFPAFRFPVTAIPVTIKIDGGVTFSATLSGQVVFGYDTNTNSWGFIDINGEKTRVTAKINGEGTLRVSADMIGIANAGGSIIARGSIGGGFSYVTVPAQQIDPLFGIDLEIAGAIDWKLGRKVLGVNLVVAEGRVEKTFYEKTIGDQLKIPYGSNLIYDNVDAWGSYTATIEKDGAFEVQDYFAQPAFSANNNKLYTVWLDYEDVNQKILFAELDYDLGTFNEPQEVITDREIITNPKVAILPSGSALITWTESRYNSSNFDTTTQDLSDVLGAQDIWATIYDISTGTFLDPFRLSDDTSSLESGRADGNANIIMGKGNYGIIVWTGADLENNSSDVYYSVIQETNDSWDFSNSELLTDLSGVNRNVNVAYIDSLTAIASWINDPDGTDSTYNSVVMYQVWDGLSWSNPDILVGNDGATNVDELSMDFNDVYGALAFTSTHYFDNGEFEKQITAYAWDNAIENWGSPYIDFDTNYYFTKPRVSVSNNGFTALTYQAIQLYSDTLDPDEGVLYMLLNDALNASNWVDNSDSTTLGDPNVYVADLVTSFDNADNLFVITQEADKTTGLAPNNPVNGVRFGNDYLNLVLRAFSVNSDLSVDGTDEPNTQSTVTVETFQKDFVLQEIYPNPFTNLTNIEFTLKTSSLVKVEVTDINGHVISKLFDSRLNEGIYNTIFEPKNLDAGVYFCRISIGNSIVTKKLILMK